MGDERSWARVEAVVSGACAGSIDIDAAFGVLDTHRLEVRDRSAMRVVRFAIRARAAAPYPRPVRSWLGGRGHDGWMAYRVLDGGLSSIGCGGVE